MGETLVTHKDEPNLGMKSSLFLVCQLLQFTHPLFRRLLRLTHLSTKFYSLSLIPQLLVHQSHLQLSDFLIT